MAFLKRQIEQALSARQRSNEPRRKLLRGIITQIDGSVSADVPQLIYVRGVEENGSIRTLLNDGVIAEPELGMLVWYEPSPNTEVSRWQLVKFDAAFYLNDRATYETLPTSGLPAHGDTHFYPPGRIPRDPGWVSSHQIVDLLVIPTDPASMRVQVLGGWYAGATNWAYLAGPLLSEDMTARIPATAGQARVVAITLDNTGALAYYNGAAFSDGIPMPPTAWPTVPISETLLTGVTLVNGMTAISSDAFNKEMRAVVTGGGGGSVVPATETEAGIAEIATQTETDTGTDDARIVTPLKLATRLATISQPWELEGGTGPDIYYDAGNVGIGDSSTTVSDLVHVRHSTDFGVRLENLKPGIAADHTIDLNFFDVNQPASQPAARIRAIKPAGTTYGFALTFSTMDGGGAALWERVRITGDGEILINKTVSEDGGNLEISDVGGDDPRISFKNPTDFATSTQERTVTLRFRHGDGIGAEIVHRRQNGQQYGFDTEFWTQPQAGGSLAERARITSEGVSKFAGSVLLVPSLATAAIAAGALEVHRATDFNVNLYNSGDTTAERGAYISWYTSGSNLGARIGAYRESGNSTGGNVVILTQPVGGSLTARIYIMSNGDVGIGTVPSLPAGGGLHVKTTSGLAAIFLDAPSGQNPAIYQGINGTAIWHQTITAATSVWSLVESGVAVRIAVATGGATTFNRSIIVGAATGGDQGVGTINVSGNIYKNDGTPYTNPDYAFEYWLTRKIEKFKNNPGADKYRRVELDDIEDYIRANLRLPGITDEKLGIFDMPDIALEKIEEAMTYIIELHRRVKELEVKYGNT